MKYLFNSFVNILAISFSILIFLLGLFNNVYKPSAFQWIYYHHIYIISFIIAILLIVGINYFKVSNKKLRIFTYGYIFIIGLIFIFGFNWNQVSDPKTMIDSMHVLSTEGVSNFIEQYDQYYQMYPYQFVYSLLIYVCININQIYGLVILKLLQLFTYIVSIHYCYKLVQLVTGKEIFIKSLSVLLVLWITPIIFTTYIYGTSFGMSFTMISLYYFVSFYKTKSFNMFLYSSLFLLIAMMMKLNFSIVLIAYFIFILFSSLSSKYKVYSSLILIVAYFGSSFINSIFYFLIIGLPLGKGIPVLAYFVMGGMPLSYFPTSVSAIPGEWNGYTIGLAEFSKLDSSVMNATSLRNFFEQVAYTLTHLSDAISFYYYKLANTWAVKDFATIDMLQSWYQSDNTYPLITIFGNTVFTNSYIGFSAISYFLIISGLLKSCISHLRHYIDDVVPLFLLIFVGFFVYHFISESKAIYIVPVIYLLLPVIALGVGGLSITLDNALSNSKMRVASIAIVIICVALLYNATRVTRYWYSDNTSGKYDIIELKSNSSINQSFKVLDDITVDSLQLFFSDVNNASTCVDVNLYINDELIISNTYNIQNNELLLYINCDSNKGDVISVEVINTSKDSLYVSTSDEAKLITTPFEQKSYMRYILFTNKTGNQWYGANYYQFIPTY